MWPFKERVDLLKRPEALRLSVEVDCVCVELELESVSMTLRMSAVAAREHARKLLALADVVDPPKKPAVVP